MRVLILLSDLASADKSSARCSALLGQGDEVAVCCVLPASHGLAGVIDAQRRITAALRRRDDGSADKVAVFVVSGEAGDGIDDCAEAWGATRVEP